MSKKQMCIVESYCFLLLFCFVVFVVIVVFFTQHHYKSSWLMQERKTIYLFLTIRWSEGMDVSTFTYVGISGFTREQNQYDVHPYRERFILRNVLWDYRGWQVQNLLETEGRANVASEILRPSPGRIPSGLGRLVFAALLSKGLHLICMRSTHLMEDNLLYSSPANLLLISSKSKPQTTSQKHSK